MADMVNSLLLHLARKRHLFCTTFMFRTTTEDIRTSVTLAKATKHELLADMGRHLMAI